MSNKRRTQIDLTDMMLPRGQVQSRKPPDLPGQESINKEHPKPKISSVLTKPKWQKQDHSTSERIRRSPWRDYKELFLLRFGVAEYFHVAERMSSTSNDRDLAMIKKISGPNARDYVQAIEQTRHASFATMLEVFELGDVYYVSFEFMPLSVAEVAGSRLITECRVAAILQPVLSGLAYLIDKGLDHSGLISSNILIDYNGAVKLWGQEYCCAPSSRKRNNRDIALITMELVQGYVDETQNVGLDDLDRWHDTQIIDFLSVTERTSSVEQLLQHPLLHIPRKKDELRGMVALAVMQISRDYEVRV